MENPAMYDCLAAQASSAEEFEAGYAARLEGSPLYITATPGWQAGWRDADIDLRHLLTRLPISADLHLQ